MKETVGQAVAAHRLIAIARGVDTERCLPLAQALYDGGFRLLELTFSQREPESFVRTARTIEALRQEFDGRMLIGAGTVLDEQQVDLAADAGAQFIVSPDVSEAVIRRTGERGMASMPGALTPSEVTAAWRYGADFVKLFPAARLGSRYVKDLRAPLSHIPLLAVGGIGAENLTEFLEAGCVGAGIGGSLVDKNLIAAGEFDRITEKARALTEQVKGKKL